MNFNKCVRVLLVRFFMAAASPAVYVVQPMLFRFFFCFWYSNGMMVSLGRLKELNRLRSISLTFEFIMYFVDTNLFKNQMSNRT